MSIYFLLAKFPVRFNVHSRHPMAGTCGPVSLAASDMPDWCFRWPLIIDICFDQQPLAFEYINTFECCVLYIPSNLHDIANNLDNFYFRVL